MLLERLKTLLSFAAALKKALPLIRVFLDGGSFLPELVVDPEDSCHGPVLPRLALKVFVTALRVLALQREPLGGHLLAFAVLGDRSECSL